MQYNFDKLVDKYENVYILQQKSHNKRIIELKFDYSFIGVGFQPNGKWHLIRGGNKMAISEKDFMLLSEKWQTTINNLVELFDALPYTKEENIIRLQKRKFRNEERIEKEKNNKQLIKNHINKINNGESSYLPKKLWIKYNEKELKKSSTKEEKIVLKNLRKTDKKNAVTQKPFTINGRTYFADIYIPKKKIVIEVDGGYHKGRIEKDKQRDADFASIGIKTIRIPNESTTDNSFHKYMKMIR